MLCQWWGELAAILQNPELGGIPLASLFLPLPRRAIVYIQVISRTRAKIPKASLRIGALG